MKRLKLIWEKFPITCLWFITIFATIPFTMISFTYYFYDDPSTIKEGINAVVFVLIWLVYSIYTGFSQKQYFLKFSLFYFPFLILSCLLADISLLFVYIAVLLTGPFNGFEYFITTNINLHLWGSVATLMLIVLCYYISYYLSRLVKVKTTN